MPADPCPCGHPFADHDDRPRCACGHLAGAHVMGCCIYRGCPCNTYTPEGPPLRSYCRARPKPQKYCACNLAAPEATDAR